MGDGQVSRYTRASLFGLNRRHVCHADGRGSVGNGFFDRLCLDIGHTGSN